MSDGPQFTHLEQPPPLRDRVYQTLEELIISGQLPPGHRLVESELADRLGVSRSPVREALQALSKAGWVDIRPRHGAQVHQPTVDEVEEFFELRVVLEVEAARRAARNADECALAELRDLLDQGQRALARQDEDGIVSANWAFHARVTQMTRNRFFVRMLGEMNRRLRWYFRPVAIARAPRSWKEHALLIDALAANDADQAAAVTRRHSESTREEYLKSNAQAGAEQLTDGDRPTAERSADSQEPGGTEQAATRPVS